MRSEIFLRPEHKPINIKTASKEKGEYIESSPPTTSPVRYLPLTLPPTIRTQRRRPDDTCPMSSGCSTLQQREKRWVSLGGGEKVSILICLYKVERFGWMMWDADSGGEDSTSWLLQDRYRKLCFIVYILKVTVNISQ